MLERSMETFLRFKSCRVYFTTLNGDTTVKQSATAIVITTSKTEAEFRHIESIST